MSISRILITTYLGWLQVASSLAYKLISNIYGVDSTGNELHGTQVEKLNISEA
jgi:hypothetical protein